MHNPRRFAALLRDIQACAGLSQESIGRLAGANRSTVNRWMRGKQQPQYLHVSRLAARLRREHPELDDLVGELLTAAGYGTQIPDAAEIPGLPPMTAEERRAVLALLYGMRAPESAQRGA